MDYQPSNALTEILRRRFQRRVGDVWYAVLGDKLGSGARTDVPDKPGWVYVMFLNGGDVNGNVSYTSPTMVRAAGAAFPNVPGTGLWIGYGYDGDLCVKAAHNKSLDAMGINTQVLNPLNQQSKFVYPWQNTYGLALAVGNSTTPSTLITIKKTRHYTGGNLLQPFDTPLQADKIDLASYIPAADTHCYAMVWLDTYLNTASVTTSVTQALSSPLGDSDLQECVVRAASSRPPDAVMFKAFYLSNAQGSITQSDYDVDVRQWLDMPNVLGFPNVLTTLERVRANYTLVTGPFTTSGVGNLDTSETGAQHIIVHKSNITNTAPGMNDDETDGYSVGSQWFNTATGILYIASDVSTGAAAWDAVAGSGAAPSSATYLVQTANAGLPNAQAMGALGTGLVKNTTATGVQTIAIAGTDYTSPTGAENLSNKAITASTVNSTPIGGTTPSTGAFTSLSALVTDTATITTTNVLTLGHDSSNTPSTSYGTGLLFQGKSSTTLARDMGRIRTVWTTATDASRVANMILSANNASGAVDMVTISPTGVGVNTTPSSTSPFKTFTGNQTAAGTYRAMEGVATALPASSGAWSLRGLYVNPAVGGANNVAITGQIVGVESDTFVNNSHASTTVDDVRGFYTPAYLAGAASITNLYGTFSRVGTSGASTGGVGVMYAFYANPFKSGSGTISAAYGLYVTAVNMATTNHAIYTNAGLVRFGDQISVIGSADRIQSIVRANATQTTNLAEWQTSGSAILASISGVGAGLLNVLDSSSTSAITNALTIGHNISGTPAAGFGTGALFQAKSSTTNDQPLATIDALWDVATHASRAGALAINVYSTTTKQEAFKAIADASGVKLGLNGAMPVARSTYGAPTGVLTRTTFDPSTVTLSQLAERVAAMITDFRSRGDFA